LAKTLLIKSHPPKGISALYWLFSDRTHIIIILMIIMIKIIMLIV